MSTTNNIGLDCCTETQPTNPITDIWQRKTAHRPMSLFDIKNPIILEVEDDNDLKELFKKYPFYPYAGDNFNSSHRMLDFYLMLAKLSPTHGACISKKTTYAVGGKVRITDRQDPVWDIATERAEPTPQAQQQYKQDVTDGIEFVDGLQGLNRVVSDNVQAVGEAYVELSYITVNGQTKVNVKTHKVKHVLPAKTDASFPLYAISTKWTPDYLHKNPPRLVSGYPAFTNDGGVLRTMFMLKTGDGVHHGRPESQEADVYKYREVQDSIYLTKQAAGNFSGQVIIEVEDGEQPTDAIDNEGAQSVGFNSFAEQFEHNFTMKADKPQSVLITTRPYGSKPMFVHQVEPNTNERFYDTMGDVAIGHITRAHGVTPRFIGKEASNGFSENAYLMDYMTNVEPTINALRELVTGFTNSILDACWDILGKPQNKQYSITFVNPIQGMIDMYKQSQIPQTPQTTTDNANSV